MLNNFSRDEGESIQVEGGSHVTTPPEAVADYACETGENPLWHPSEKRLYWTDIPTGRLFRYDPVTESHEQCYSGRPVGGFTIQSDGSLLLFMDRGTIALWREGQVTELIPEVAVELNSRFNDVIADPAGRVFCGTMSSSDSKGRLYCLDVDGSLSPLLEGVGCSNGMAFSADQRSFYYTDSFAHEIYLFDYAIESGVISNRRVFGTIPESAGLPDGCTLDAQGSLWSALWGGAAVVRLDTAGRIVEHIPLPVPKVSSVTFAGDDYRDMYITTAGGHEKRENGSLAGALFRCRSHSPGVPEYFSRILVNRAEQSRDAQSTRLKIERR